MKKRKLALFICLIFAALMMTSCDVLIRNAEQDLKAAVNEAETVTDENGDVLETRFFGTYTVPTGWIELPEFSSNEKWFYTKEGIDFSSPTSNISVECGTNGYKPEEHETFRDAILQQLMLQTANDGSELEGTGTYTEKGYNLYIFTISKDGGSTTTQYYIVGDMQYVMVHVTDFHDARITDLNDAAKIIVDSFTWEQEIPKDPQSSQQDTAGAEQNKESPQTRVFGTYMVPARWVELTQYSDQRTWVYTKEGVDFSTPTSSFMLTCVAEEYTESDYEDLMLEMTQGIIETYPGYDIDVSEIITTQGYHLFIFTMAKEGEYTVTEYYIIGNERFLFISVTDCEDPRMPDINEAARQLADSFIWE